ncbi:hypothetical protein FC50_GL000946 [Lacticaseibacillus pantheris DSM 15945 = JCM 12539 = NBRC 106106]|uniref:DUF4355 domain-containing protein n=1 Tax=Lacticaseibacillus pantheris DSM 15945 = JCM 12539 = NBRC 106106 TaxID=1423783 RepID=A0A0R1U581_9LACO|nr:DUF4355 domain-containing protein [Lacticaseibacillus pantheris]KRL86424.1 hypothetical protein FC50_GL000946 [Lacticaseibacillus pantheris DSM 15945 = JCM 12539 = NBRC 106106]
MDEANNGANAQQDAQSQANTAGSTAASGAAQSAGQAGQNNQNANSAASGAGTITTEQMNEIITERLGRQREKLQKESDETIAKKVKEALERANMTPEQQAAAEQDDRDKELNQLKAELARRDRKEHATSAAQAAKIPAELVPFLTRGTDEETDKAITDFGKAFSSAVQSAVEERMKGHGTPGVGSQTSGKKPDDFGARLAKAYAPRSVEHSYFSK